MCKKMAKLRGHCSFRYHLILIVTSISSTSSCSSSSSSSSVLVRNPKRHILLNLGPHMMLYAHWITHDTHRASAQSLLFIGKTFALFPYEHAPTLYLTQHHQHHITNIHIYVSLISNQIPGSTSEKHILAKLNIVTV